MNEEIKEHKDGSYEFELQPEQKSLGLTRLKYKLGHMKKVSGNPIKIIVFHSF